MAGAGGRLNRNSVLFTDGTGARAWSTPRATPGTNRELSKVVGLRIYAQDSTFNLYVRTHAGKIHFHPSMSFTASKSEASCKVTAGKTRNVIRDPEEAGQTESPVRGLEQAASPHVTHRLQADSQDQRNFYPNPNQVCGERNMLSPECRQGMQVRFSTCGHPGLGRVRE